MLCEAIGRYIAQRMAKAGWRVRVAVRRPNEAMFVKPYGAVGQVEPVLANIRNEASVRAAIKGADAVVNAVSVLVEYGEQNFASIQTEGAERIARITAEEGAANLLHISAIGADADSESKSARTRAEGEALVMERFPDAVILRPSVLFGTEDNFFNKFARMAKLSPTLPLVGAETLFQPVYVDDVAAAAETAITSEAAAGVYELGGPEVASFRDLMHKMLRVTRRRKLIVNLPFWIAGIIAPIIGLAHKLSIGIVPAIITSDQVKQLRYDNVVSDGARGFSDLGIAPRMMDGILESYLYCHRPHGQYTAIKQSAENLRG